FNENDAFTSSDDELLCDEDVPKDNVKICSNPLFEFYDEYISSDVNPLFDEVLENIDSKDSYISNLDELAFSDANEDKCFDPGGDFDEIDAFLDIDVSTDIKDGYHDLEGDIIYLESLLINNTIPNLPPGVFLDHDPRSLKDEPDNDELKSMVKDSSLLLFSGSEDTIFDPDISVFSCYSLEPVVSHRSGTFIFDPFVEIPSGESKVHIEVLSVLWGNRLPIPDGSLPLSSMRMEQYLTHTDYALWEVIVNGDAPTAIASASAGTEGLIPPKTAEQKLAKKNELKAKSTLLLVIPDEHLLKFHGIKNTKTL
ncbi:hypothetical protein Tco_0889964, partial [Tanacetum coccineum]